MRNSLSDMGPTFSAFAAGCWPTRTMRRTFSKPAFSSSRERLRRFVKETQFPPGCKPWQFAWPDEHAIDAPAVSNGR